MYFPVLHVDCGQSDCDPEGMEEPRPDIDREGRALWRIPKSDEVAALYAEAATAAYYFSDWRHNLLKYFLTFSGALAVATEWLDQHHQGSQTAVPFAVGYVVSLMLAWMDYRNMLLLRIAHGVAASIESRWGVGGEMATKRWAYSEGAAPSGFYSAIADLQPLRNTKAWSRRQRWSSYSVTMTLWFLLAAVAFAVGTAVILAKTRSDRLAIAVAALMLIGIVVFTFFTREIPLWPPRWRRAAAETDGDAGDECVDQPA
jgi:hypothetical protein